MPVTIAGSKMKNVTSHREKTVAPPRLLNGPQLVDGGTLR